MIDRTTIQLYSKLARSGWGYRYWYDDARVAVERTVPRSDVGFFCGILAATSINASVPKNVTLAVRCYSNWLEGRPWSGILRPVVSRLDDLLVKRPWPASKVESFRRALLGGSAAIPVDRWMVRVSFGNVRVTPRRTSYITSHVLHLALKLKIEPRRLQAAIWTGVRLASGHTPTGYPEYLYGPATWLDLPNVPT